MNTISLLLIGTFLISMLTGFCFIPFILNFCRRNKLYDIPDERKVHHAAIPDSAEFPSCQACCWQQS